MPYNSVLYQLFDIHQPSQSGFLCGTKIKIHRRDIESRTDHHRCIMTDLPPPPPCGVGQADRPTVTFRFVCLHLWISISKYFELASVKKFIFCYFSCLCFTTLHCLLQGRQLDFVWHFAEINLNWACALPVLTERNFDLGLIYTEVFCANIATRAILCDIYSRRLHYSNFPKIIHNFFLCKIWPPGQ